MNSSNMLSLGLRRGHDDGINDYDKQRSANNKLAFMDDVILKCSLLACC